MLTVQTCRHYACAPELLDWVDSATTVALEALVDPALDRWWRAERTWFVGVDALPNDAQGRVGDGPVPAGPAIELVSGLSDAPWHRLQLSAVRAGYPGSGAKEEPRQHRFRLNRDGAHLDGLLPVGPNRRRYLREPHAFILGIALSDGDAGASPLVVWEGSETIMRDAFTVAFAGRAPADWCQIDVTEVYANARREVFRRCRRRLVPLRRGEAVLLHRLAIHGISPWTEGAHASPEGRLVAYLRPRAQPLRWLTAP